MNDDMVNRSKSESSSSENRCYFMEYILKKMNEYFEKNKTAKTAHERTITIIEMFEFLISQKQHLSKFDKGFKTKIYKKINYFMNIDDPTTDFSNKMKTIKFELTPYLLHNQNVLNKK